MKILIVIDKKINPKDGSGVASWAMDLSQEFKRQGVWCEVAGYYESESPFNIDGQTQEEKNRKVMTIIEKNQIFCVISATSWTAFQTWDKMDSKIIKIATIHGAKESIVKRELLGNNRVDAFICVSAPVREIVGKWNIATPVFRINNGIRLEPHLPTYRKKKQVLWIGRLQMEQKRAHWLKYAAQILGKYGYTLHVVGSGWVKPWLARQSQNIVWHDQLDRAEVRKLMKESQAVLLTSYYEGLSISLLEAMSCGCMILAPDLDRTRSGVLNSDNCILYHVNGGMRFKKNYYAELEKAVERLSLETTFTCVQNGFETLRQECSIVQQAQEYLNVIGGLGSRKKDSPRCNRLAQQFLNVRYRRFGIFERNYRRIADRLILHLA